MVVGSNPVTVSKTSDIAPISSKELFDTEATIEYRLNLKRVRDMITKDSQMHRINAPLGQFG